MECIWRSGSGEREPKPKVLVDIMALRTETNHCSGRDLGVAFDGVAQRK